MSDTVVDPTIDAAQQPAEHTPGSKPGRRGRPRDASRDEAILTAARDLIAEVGFDAMTMDAVAARAGAGKATVYRRWGSKSELAVDALLCGVRPVARIEDVPDTGSLRGDLAAMAKLRHQHRAEKDDNLMQGMLSEVRRDPELGQAFHRHFVTAKVDLVRGILERARDRGEIAAGRDLAMIAEIGPAMIAYRKVIVGAESDPTYLDRIVENIVIPLATAPGATAPEQ